MFERSDRKFVEMAFDPARRQEAIGKITAARNVQFAVSLLFGVIGIVQMVRGADTDSTFFGFLVLTMSCMHTDTLLRLLKVVDRLSAR